jgi:hypothetical protein
MHNMTNPALEKLQQDLADGRLTLSALDDGSGVALDVESEKLVSLNASGLTILQAIADGADSEEAIATVLVKRFAVTPESARADAKTFLARLTASL